MILERLKTKVNSEGLIWKKTCACGYQYVSGKEKITFSLARDVRKGTKIQDFMHYMAQQKLYVLWEHEDETRKRKRKTATARKNPINKFKRNVKINSNTPHILSIYFYLSTIYL